MATAAAAEGGGGEIEVESESGGGFECNICFGVARDPVITRCGHLHCWPCLYEWLRFHSQCHECPVCKAVIRDEELIPLNGRSGSILRRRLSAPPRRRSGGGRSAPPAAAVVRVRLREFSSQLNGYGAWGGGGGGGGGVGGGEGLEEGNVNGDNMKKIMFFILLFVVFDFLII